MELGEKLKNSRIHLGLTQEQVAQHLFVSRQAVSNWEAGKNYPDLTTIVLLSDFYEISLDTLLKGDKKMLKNVEKTGIQKYIQVAILGVGLLAVMTCVIVEFAVSKKLSWSLIVMISVGLGGGLLALMFRPQENKGKSILMFITVSMPLYLIVLQYLQKLSNPQTSIWVWKIGIPITVVWLLILWATHFLQRKKADVFTVGAISMLYCICGNIATSLIIILSDHAVQTSQMISSLLTSMLFLVAAAVFTYFGKKRNIMKQNF